MRSRVGRESITCMSLSSTSTIKQQLTQALGAAKAPNYFAALQAFVKGQLSRAEFEDVVCALLDVPALVQLHNALIISLFDATAVLRRPPTPPPPPAPKQPPTKRRRVLLPYQGPTTPDDARSFKSSRVKRWALTVGRKERDRLRNVVPFQDPQPKPDSDEIARERGVVLLPERGGMDIYLTHRTTDHPPLQIPRAAVSSSISTPPPEHPPFNTL